MFVRRIGFALVLIGAVSMPLDVLAQTEAALVGVVADESKAVLPGVTVVATDLGTGRKYLATTDIAGLYRVASLPPGTYHVQVQLPGFADIVVPSLELLVGQTARMNFAMKLASVAETVTVTSQAPLVETMSSEIVGNVDRRQMEELPISGRNWLELSMMIKGITANSIDQRPGTNSDDQFQLNLDGQQVTQKVASSSFGQPKFSREAIAEFQIVTNLFDITQGRSTGIQVQAISRSGANRRDGSVYGYFRDDRFNAADPVAGRVLPFENQQVGGATGGPIIRDKMHYFGSYEYERQPTTLLLQPAQLPNQSWTFPSTITQNSVLARVDYVATARDNISLRGSFWNLLDPFSAGSGSHPSQALRRKRDTMNVQVTWTRVLNDEMVQVAKAGYNSFGWLDEVYFDRFLEPSHFGTAEGTPALVFPGITIGAVRDNPLAHYQHLPSFGYDLAWHRGRHDIKLGGEWLPWYDDGFWNFRRRGEFVFSTRPADLDRRFPQDAYADPSRWDLTGLDPSVQRFDINSIGQDDGWNFDVPRKTWALWFGDTWRMTSNLTVNFGVRWDVDWGGLAPPHVPGNVPFAPFGSTPLFKTDIRDLNNVAPRGGFAYNVGGTNNLVIRGGSGLYYNTPYSNLTYSQQSFNGSRILVNAFNNDRNPGFLTDPMRGITTDAIRQGLVPQPPQSPRVIAHDFEDMHAWQSSIGFQKQLSDVMGVESDLTYSKESNLARGRDINLVLDPATGYNVNPNVRRLDPRYGEVMWMESTGSADLLSLSSALTRRFRDNFQAGVTYTLMLRKHDDTTIFLIQANNQFDLDDEWAPSSDFQRHTVRANAIYRLPWNMSVAALYFFGSGNRIATTVASQPFGKPGTNRLNIGAPIRIPENMLDRFDGPAVIGTNEVVPRNALHGLPLHKVDVRFTKELRLGGRVRLSAMAEVFNLLNHDNFGSYNGQVDSTTFGQPRQNTGNGYVPRSGQLGFRMAF